MIDEELLIAELNGLIDESLVCRAKMKERMDSTEEGSEEWKFARDERNAAGIEYMAYTTVKNIIRRIKGDE